MGGKGRRRREKNYLAAHGGNNRLPPPPNARDLETLPYKLRKIIQLKNISAGKQGATGSSAENVKGKKKGESFNEEKPNPRDAQCMTTSDNVQEVMLEKTKNIVMKDNVTDANSGLADGRKRKRKKKSASDLRFENLDQLAAHSKRKERKKQYLEKRKTKDMKAMLNEILDFPGREDVKFGEVVQAPPKLSLPKVPKNFIDASKERLRLQAVELYRKRRAWESRPGIKLPSLGESST